MKTLIAIVCIIVLSTVYGQSDSYKVLLDSAKALFKSERTLSREELDMFDYGKVVSMLERVVDLKPNNAEARYFLGYAYSRSNSRDGRGMIDMNPNLVYKCSEQLEKVIELTPKYTGELIVLDPYSKLSSEWGSLAMSYWHNSKADSAVWAFQEGKKRGGFGTFVLDLNKAVLDACSENAILISSGDNFSIPLWYLQIVENYRTDVSVVDISLLNTTWYPALLSQRGAVSFDLPQEVMDTMDYTLWTDSLVSIENFSWMVKPSYYDYYLLRGDRVFLSLLKANKFERDVYFTIGFIEENRLSLTDYLSPQVLVDKLTVFQRSGLDEKAYKETISKAFQLTEVININSEGEIGLLDHFRYDILRNAYNHLENGDKTTAQALLDLMDRLASEKKYPYQDEYLRKLDARLRKRL